MGAIRGLYGEPLSWRSRPIVLLPYAGLGALPVAAAQLAASGARRDDVVAADRNPERDPCLGAGRPVLGQRWKGVRAARSVATVLLGRPSADPRLLGLSRLAAVVGLWQRASPDHAGLRPGAG